MVARRTRRTASAEQDWKTEQDGRDKQERRRLQNRVNQRNFRQRKRAQRKKGDETDGTDSAGHSTDTSITVAPPAPDDDQGGNQGVFPPFAYDNHPAEYSQHPPISPFVLVQSPCSVFTPAFAPVPAPGEPYCDSVDINSTPPVVALDPSSRK